MDLTVEIWNSNITADALNCKFVQNLANLKQGAETEETFELLTDNKVTGKLHVV